MQKNLKKVHFLKKYWLENLERITKPLKFFVQKISFDMYVIVPEFKKIVRFVLKTVFWPLKAIFCKAHKSTSTLSKQKMDFGE